MIQDHYSHHSPKRQGCLHLGFKGQDCYPAEPSRQDPCKDLRGQGSARPKRWGVPLSHGVDAIIPVGLIGGTTVQWVWIAEHQTKEDYSQSLVTNGICSVRFWTCSGPITPFFFPISPFWDEDIPPLILKAPSLSGFRGSQLERSSASGWIISLVSSISNLDDI